MISHSSHRPARTLRERMIEDMSVRGFSAKTRNDYIPNVRAFAVFIGRSPDTATAEDLRRFHLHQTQSGMQPPSLNSAVSALRFFFTVTPARYTHRVAVSNSRLIALDEQSVRFRYKDYRHDGQARYRTMTLAPDEFIRRFLLHVLPKRVHRIRHYGLLASASGKSSIARARELITAPRPSVETPAEHEDAGSTGAGAKQRPPCPWCGGRMIIVETLKRDGAPRDPPSPDAAVGTATS